MEVFSLGTMTHPSARRSRVQHQTYTRPTHLHPIQFMISPALVAQLLLPHCLLYLRRQAVYRRPLHQSPQVLSSATKIIASAPSFDSAPRAVISAQRTQRRSILNQRTFHHSWTTALALLLLPALDVIALRHSRRQPAASPPQLQPPQPRTDPLQRLALGL